MSESAESCGFVLSKHTETPELEQKPYFMF